MTTLAQKMRGQVEPQKQPKQVEKPKPLAYVACGKCNYIEFVKYRYGPQHVMCYGCGGMITVKMVVE